MKILVSRRILPGITGKTSFDLQKKIFEAQKLKIKKVALFLEFLNKKERKKIYSTLLGSKIKKIPFCHIRHDMSKQELIFLRKKFKIKYFNTHEDYYKHKKEWKDFSNKMLIEFNYNNKIPKELDISQVAGFCIDLSHFKASQERWTKEFFYVIKRHKFHKLFIANHLNGYSKKRKRDLHTVKSLKELDYLKTLPKFVFGKYIALEMFNSIKEQLKFKKYIVKILRNKL